MGTTKTRAYERGTLATSLLALVLALGGCRRADESEHTNAREVEVAPRHEPATDIEPPAPADPALAAWLDGALLEARYETTALAELGQSLPRPTPNDSPLVATFAAIVERLSGDPATRLTALGLEPGAPIELSVRALDGRAAAVRKLLGELAEDASADPRLVAQLSSEARTLGAHLRASLPTDDPERLLAALRLISSNASADTPDPWAAACEALRPRASLCTGRSRMLVWARPLDDAHIRVDAIYLFHTGADAADLDRAIARADGWPARAKAPSFAQPGRLQLLVHAEPTRALLDVEALADAVVAFAEPETDARTAYYTYLDRERALRELHPSTTVFEGIALDIDYDAVGDRLHIQLRWLRGQAPAPELDGLFAPIVERGTLPVLHGDCAAAEACVRVGGLASLARFAPLAVGAFADTTGAGRILRQAGERGLVMLALSSWPNLLGTAGATAAPSRGVIGKAESALLRDSYGVGLMLLELGDDPEAELGERWVGYLRVGPEALDALRPAAALIGLSPEPVELPGVEASVERGEYEGTSIYLVDEVAPRFGGWVVAADADARVDWLLETPREARTEAELDPLAYLRIASLGPIAAREQLAYSDDPPIRRWLDGRSLELRARFDHAGPIVELELGPK